MPKRYYDSKGKRVTIFSLEELSQKQQPEITEEERECYPKGNLDIETEKVLDKLTKTQREVISLYCFKFLSIKEISRILKISISAVYKRRETALKRLKTLCKNPFL